MEKIGTHVCKFYTYIPSKTVTTCNGFDVKERGVVAEEWSGKGIAWR